MRFPWALVWADAVGDSPPNQRGFFMLPQGAMAATFFLSYVSGGGILRVTLLFGFETKEIAVFPAQRVQIIFPPLNPAVGALTALRSFNFDRLQGPSGGEGSIPGIVPPLVAVKVTTTRVGGFPVGISYEIYACCVGV